MKATIFENGIPCSLHGDYCLPDLQLEPEHRPIGRWGRIHRDYLKKYRPVIISQLVLSGDLWTYLADINEQALQRLEVLIAQLKSAEKATEELKAADQIAWNRIMNSIRFHTEEIVLQELIFK